MLELEQECVFESPVGTERNPRWDGWAAGSARLRDGQADANA